MNPTKVTAVTISREKAILPIAIPHYCYTEAYRPILHHDNSDPDRIRYLTNRYNQAVKNALVEYPDTEHLLIIDSYYLRFKAQVGWLLNAYERLEKIILGASIWFWDRSRIRPFIQYYDTLSVRELNNKRWYSLNQLPTGLLPVSGVGGCFLFPRTVWELSSGFSIPRAEPQAGGSRGLRTEGFKVLLDCDARLWRTHADNPDIPDYPLVKRVRVSLGELRRRFLRELPFT